MTRTLRFYGLLAVIMGGQIVSLAVDRSSWPYSTFAMFSYTPLEGRTLQRFVLVGVAKDGSEISLEPCLRPLTPLQVHQGIAMARERSDDAVRRLLRDTFDRCAPLVAVKIHEVTWQLAADPEPLPPQRIEVASYP